MDGSEQCVIFEAIICVKLASLASARVRTPHLVLPGDWRGTRLVDSGGCLPHKFGSFESFEHQTFTRKLWGKQKNHFKKILNGFVFLKCPGLSTKICLRSTKITSFGQCPAVQEYDPTTKRLTLVRNTELEFLDAPGFIPVGFGRRFSKDMRKFLSARDHSFSIFWKLASSKNLGNAVEIQQKER